MARHLENIILYIEGDPEDAPNPTRLILYYDVVDGKARKRMQRRVITNVANKVDKVFHTAGAAGEFWRDEIDGILQDEGIPVANAGVA